MVLAFAALSAVAQNKIDLPGRMVIEATRALETPSRTPLRLVENPYATAPSPSQTYTAIVEFDSDDLNLGNEQVEVLARRGNMAIVRVTASQIEELAAQPQVTRVSLGNEAKLLMNNARKTTGVDKVQTGADGLGGTKYTGKGVIAGLMDQGLDVNHINFLNADGEPRTTALWTITGKNGTTTAYLTPEKIKGFTSEMKNETHGTHVLGIMAGSYNGPAEYAFINSNNSVQLKKQNGINSKMPYYGIATEAELAVACGTFVNRNIEIGAEKVVSYAAEQGKPCVLNLSIGNTSGPHDGTDADSKWFAELGKDAIICIAAGNDGDAGVSIIKTFTGEPLRTFVSSKASAEGQVDFWGVDARLFTVRFIAYDKTTGKEVFSYAIDKNLEGKTVNLTGKDYNASGYIHDDKFDKAFSSDSYVMFSSNIDPANNRYNVFVSMMLKGTSTNIAPGFVVEAKAGQRVDSYANGALYFQSLGINGFVDGNADNSINGMACGDNIIVVGSYTNISSWPTLNGGVYGYNYKPVAGAISSFSSYGQTFSGKLLPDICAPGGSVIASYSKYFVDGGGIKEHLLSGKYTGKTRNSYWAEMQGTSMACPFVAGVVATWLQADPTLTVDDVKSIMKETSTHDEFTAVEPHRWGYGKINAIAGLKKILNLSGISDVTADEQEAIVTAVSDKSYEVFVAGAKNLKAKLYNLSGLCVAEAASDDDTVVLSADTAAAGVYVLRVDSDRNSESRKIVIR